MVGGQRGDGGNQTDDESLRETAQTNRASKQMDAEQSLQRRVVFRVSCPLTQPCELQPKAAIFAQCPYL